MVNSVSHITFVRVIGHYKKGTHLDNPKFEKFITYRRGKNIRIEAPEGFLYSFDGELINQNDFTVEVVPKAIRFAVPKSAKPLPGELHIPCCEKQAEECFV